MPIVVHPSDDSAGAHSLTQALTTVQAGDVILVEPGVYSPSHTHEVLPLTIPAGVTVEGVDQDACVIDGAGQFKPSFDPIRPEMSVVCCKWPVSAASRSRTVAGMALAFHSVRR
jgi:hypothetical protein